MQKYKKGAKTVCYNVHKKKRWKGPENIFIEINYVFRKNAMCK